MGGKRRSAAVRDNQRLMKVTAVLCSWAAAFVQTRDGLPLGEGSWKGGSRGDWRRGNELQTEESLLEAESPAPTRECQNRNRKNECQLRDRAAQKSRTEWQAAAQTGWFHGPEGKTAASTPETVQYCSLSLHGRPTRLWLHGTSARLMLFVHGWNPSARGQKRTRQLWLQAVRVFFISILPSLGRGDGSLGRISRLDQGRGGGRRFPGRKEPPKQCEPSNCKPNNVGCLLSVLFSVTFSPSVSTASQNKPKENAKRLPPAASLAPSCRLSPQAVPREIAGFAAP